MPTPLRRYHLALSTGDDRAVRDWILDRVRSEIRHSGHPRPRVVLVGAGFEERLDLGAALSAEPEAHPGATFRALRARPGVERRFLVAPVTGEQQDGGTLDLALVLEERHGPRPSWWLALLPYRIRPETGLGEPAPQWSESESIRRQEQLPEFAREWLAVPPGARPAQMLEPGPQTVDITAAVGEIPSHVPLPDTPVLLFEMVVHLFKDDLLSGRVDGTIVLLVRGRSWQMFVLREPHPAPLRDLVRYLAEVYDEPAEGAAILQVSLFPHVDPPRPGLQAIAETGGQYVERWALLEDPETPGGPRRLGRTFDRGVKPVPEAGGFLGIDPGLDFDLAPVVVGEA